MGIEQDWKGISGSWPATGSVFALTPLNQITPIEQTFGQVQAALPDAAPWSQSNWFFDPNRKDPSSQQWNSGNPAADDQQPRALCRIPGRLAPETPAAYYERAKLRVLLGDDHQARLRAEQASALRTHRALYWTYRCINVYSRLGDPELARQYAELTKAATIPIQNRAGN